MSATLILSLRTFYYVRCGSLRLGRLAVEAMPESAPVTRESLHVDERTFVVALNDALERPRLVDRKNANRQLLVAAQRKCRRVHHLQVAADRLVETDRAVARSGGVFLGISGIYAIHLG